MNLFHARKTFIPLWIDYEAILSLIAVYPTAGLLIQTMNKKVSILALSRNVLTALTSSARATSIKYVFRGLAKGRRIAK